MNSAEVLKQANCGLDFSSEWIGSEADMLIPVILCKNHTGFEFYCEARDRIPHRLRRSN